MSTFKIARNLSDSDGNVARHHDLYSAEMHLRTEWNRYTGSAIVRRVKGLFRAIARHFEVTQTMSELHALDDRLLADIGLYRNDISRVAHKLADATTAPVASNVILSGAPAATAPAAFTAPAAHNGNANTGNIGNGTTGKEAANTDAHRQAA